MSSIKSQNRINGLPINHINISKTSIVSMDDDYNYNSQYSNNSILLNKTNNTNNTTFTFNNNNNVNNSNNFQIIDQLRTFNTIYEEKGEIAREEIDNKFNNIISLMNNSKNQIFETLNNLDLIYELSPLSANLNKNNNHQNRNIFNNYNNTTNTTFNKYILPISTQSIKIKNRMMIIEQQEFNDKHNQNKHLIEIQKQQQINDIKKHQDQIHQLQLSEQQSKYELLQQEKSEVQQQIDKLIKKEYQLSTDYQNQLNQLTLEMESEKQSLQQNSQKQQRDQLIKLESEFNNKQLDLKKQFDQQLSSQKQLDQDKIKQQELQLISKQQEIEKLQKSLQQAQQQVQVQVVSAPIPVVAAPVVQQTQQLPSKLNLVKSTSVKQAASIQPSTSKPVPLIVSTASVKQQATTVQPPPVLMENKVRLKKLAAAVTPSKSKEESNKEYQSVMNELDGASTTAPAGGNGKSLKNVNDKKLESMKQQMAFDEPSFSTQNDESSINLSKYLEETNKSVENAFEVMTNTLKRKNDDQPTTSTTTSSIGIKKRLSDDKTTITTSKPTNKLQPSATPQTSTVATSTNVIANKLKKQQEIEKLRLEEEERLRKKEKEQLAKREAEKELERLEKKKKNDEKRKKVEENQQQRLLDEEKKKKEAEDREIQRKQKEESDKRKREEEDDAKKRIQERFKEQQEQDRKRDEQIKKQKLLQEQQQEAEKIKKQQQEQQQQKIKKSTTVQTILPTPQTPQRNAATANSIATTEDTTASATKAKYALSSILSIVFGTSKSDNFKSTASREQDGDEDEEEYDEEEEEEEEEEGEMEEEEGSESGEEIEEQFESDSSSVSQPSTPVNKSAFNRDKSIVYDSDNIEIDQNIFKTPLPKNNNNNNNNINYMNSPQIRGLSPPSSVSDYSPSQSDTSSISNTSMSSSTSSGKPKPQHKQLNHSNSFHGLSPAQIIESIPQKSINFNSSKLSPFLTMRNTISPLKNSPIKFNMSTVSSLSSQSIYSDDDIDEMNDDEQDDILGNSSHSSSNNSGNFTPIKQNSNQILQHNISSPENSLNKQYPIVSSPSAQEGDENYYFEEEEIDCEFDKRVPDWAKTSNLDSTLKQQRFYDPDRIFSLIGPVYLYEIFPKQEFGGKIKDFTKVKRNLSSEWSLDKNTDKENAKYKQNMGFINPIK